MLFDTEAELHECLNQFKAESSAYLVSKSLPLLSNLNIAENISIILEYHHNIPTKQALKVTKERLDSVGIAESSTKREPHISEHERFVSMFIRASIMGNTVGIDRPFSILENDQNGDFIAEILEKADTMYSKVAIFDFSYNKERYGALYV